MTGLNWLSSPRLVETAPAPQLIACVIMPAKDEASSLWAALASLAHQIGLHGQPFPPNRYEVILLVNNSEDSSLAVAREFGEQHPSLKLHVIHRDFPTSEAHIGNARRMLMNEASRRLLASPQSLKTILSTDADTQVAPDWIAQNLREIENGAQAVGGVIELSVSEREVLPARIREMQLLDDRYRSLGAWLEHQRDPQVHDAWPRHYHHFGASLAVTVTAYLETGGMPPERQLEDVAFYEALQRRDLRFRHSPAVKVWTSARLKGRTQIGLAEQLNQWNGPHCEGSQTPVDSVEYLSLYFRSRQVFRALWSAAKHGAGLEDEKQGELCRIARVDLRQLREAFGRQYFGAAWETLDLGCSLRKQIGEGKVKQPIADAISELQRLFNSEHAAKTMTDAASPALRIDRSGIVPVCIP